MDKPKPKVTSSVPWAENMTTMSFRLGEATGLLHMVIANLRHPEIGGISEEQMLHIEEFLDYKNL